MINKYREYINLFNTVKVIRLLCNVDIFCVFIISSVGQSVIV